MSHQVTIYKLQPEPINHWGLVANSNVANSQHVATDPAPFPFRVLGSREDFEKKCAPLMERCKAVLQSAIKASEVPLDQIDSVEIVGGLLG